MPADTMTPRHRTSADTMTPGHRTSADTMSPGHKTSADTMTPGHRTSTDIMTPGHRTSAATFLQHCVNINSWVPSEGRDKKPAHGQHRHCEACFKVHCRAPVEISISCTTTSCRLHCGAVFHLCKEDEHRMLCPNEIVPCLNASFGCPITLPRHRLGPHLEACPASLVNCSLEWNRWPAAETDAAFCQSIVLDQGPEEPLDLALALRDQKLLFSSLKMDSLFPELTEGAVMATSIITQDHKEANWGTMAEGGSPELGERPLEAGLNAPEVKELSQEEREALAKSRDVAGINSYTAWESIFSKELCACQPAAQSRMKGSNGRAAPVEQDRDTRGSEGAVPMGVAKTGLAPWQDGVLERLGKEVNIAEYNMYLVHHGSMLIQFGQLEACTPRERDFVYGGLEPIEVETVHSFTVPSSYTAKRRNLKDPFSRVKRSNKEVDTADLGVSVEDIPKWDEIQATLLCSLEKELRGHPICETVATDGLFMDLGTQTYDFAFAPFKKGTTLADVTTDRTLGLHVQIQTESVTRRHSKASSAFTFLCGHTFRRDEFAWHFRNVHSDLQSALNGWFLQRCPLAYLGCTYRQIRFQPATHRATVTYDQNFGTFALRPDVSLVEGAREPVPEWTCMCGMDGLSRLPFEVLQRIASFLDSFSLSQLSLVSRLMRDVSATLLQDRGMVSLKWERATDPHGRSSWKCRMKVWQFSSSFSAIEQWCFDNMPSMAEHLKVCPFYETEVKSEPLALTGLMEGLARPTARR